MPAACLLLSLLLSIPYAADGETASQQGQARAKSGEAKKEPSKESAQGGETPEKEEAAPKNMPEPRVEGGARGAQGEMKKPPSKDGGLKSPQSESEKELQPYEEPLEPSEGTAAEPPQTAPSVIYQAPPEDLSPSIRWERGPDAGAPEKARFTPKDVKAPERRAAAEKAAKMADGFRSSFKPVQQEPPASSPARNLDVSKPSSASRFRSPDPSKPLTAADLALAGQGPYRHAFELHALKAGSEPGGAPAVLRKDGSPASAAEMETLSRFIRAEPAALMRRPDFYSVVPRERFLGLKSDVAVHPERPQYRHIALSSPEPRDFVWTESCAAVSGDCNPAAAGKSYQRGEFVPPEALAKIWDELDEELEQDETVQARREAGEKLSRRVLEGSPLLSRLRSGVRRLFGNGRDEAAPELRDGDAPAPAPQAAVEGSAPASTKEPPSYAPAPARSHAAPASPKTAPASASRALGPRLAALAGVLLVLFLLKRRLTP